MVLGPRNMKTTHRKSYLENLLQMLNWIFDQYVKVQLDHHIEKAFYLLYYCSLGFFMVRPLPVFLNTRRDISTTAVALFWMNLYISAVRIGFTGTFSWLQLQHGILDLGWLLHNRYIDLFFSPGHLFYLKRETKRCNKHGVTVDNIFFVTNTKNYDFSKTI